MKKVMIVHKDLLNVEKISNGKLETVATLKEGDEVCDFGTMEYQGHYWRRVKLSDEQKDYNYIYLSPKSAQQGTVKPLRQGVNAEVFVGSSKGGGCVSIFALLSGIGFIVAAIYAPFIEYPTGSDFSSMALNIFMAVAFGVIGIFIIIPAIKMLISIITFPDILKLKANGDVDALITALKYKDIMVQRGAIVALSQLKSPEAIDALITTLLTDSNNREYAAKYLVLLAKNQDPAFPDEIIKFLRDNPSGHIIRLLTDFLKIPDENVKQNALTNLTNIVKEQRAQEQRIQEIRRAQEQRTQEMSKKPIAVGGDQNAEWTDKPLLCPKCGTKLNEKTPRFGAVRCPCGAYFTVRNYNIE